MSYLSFFHHTDRTSINAIMSGSGPLKIYVSSVHFDGEVEIFNSVYPRSIDQVVPDILIY